MPARLCFLAAALAVALPGGALADDEPEAADIRLNQAGFERAGPKRAILADAATDPLDWQLVAADGSVAARGRTVVAGQDAASGEHVHVIDFSGFRGAGAGYRIEAGKAASHAFDVGDSIYASLKKAALAYFYHNRSGIPIEAEYAGERWARPAGHKPDTATCRTGKDPLGNDWPGCDYTLDLTGGWYDAGDQGKYVVNGGISVWTLQNSVERQTVFHRPSAFPDGSAAIPEAGNGIDDLLDEARIGMEFLLAMQAPAGAKARVPVGVTRPAKDLAFSEIDAGGMAHHKMGDTEWTPLPTLPHEDPMPRVLYPVSTGATLNLAATAAQCARLWQAIDPVFAARCLTAAETAWGAAIRNPAVHFAAPFSGSGMYGDSDFADEFYWAAAELYATTGKAAYGDALKASSWHQKPVEDEPAWPETAPLGVMTLALAGRDMSTDARAKVVAAADGFLADTQKTGYRVPYASLDYFWGSNSNFLNRAIILGLARDISGKMAYRDAMVDVMDYLLGRNPLDRSYVTGYGTRPMQHPHHRFWAWSLDPAIPPAPPGALSGGPNNMNGGDETFLKLKGKCAPMTCWRDDIWSPSLNEVAINWNAPLVWVAAYLDERAR